MYITIDVGGTNTRVGISDDFERLIETLRFSTPTTFDKLKELVSLNIEKLSDKHNTKIDGIVLGLPAALDHGQKKVSKSANLNQITGRNYTDFISGTSIEGTPLFVQNDAMLAALAEATLGSGKAHEVCATLIISTGIGGARVKNKELDETWMISEPGHHIFDVRSDVKDGTGIQGTFEALFSGTAILRQYGVKGEECEDPEMWEAYGKALSLPVLNVLLFWNPQVLVFGGSVSNRFELFISGLKNELLKYNSLVPTPELYKSQFMDDAGLIGGLVYLKTRLGV